eukprot:SM000121S26019  [mRNA]  locus=s121:335685:335947:+ [translate_table: standard]
MLSTRARTCTASTSWRHDWPRLCSAARRFASRMRC